jgi:hypothetical protein
MYGEMREWLKRAACEAAIPFGVSGVRIPLSFHWGRFFREPTLSLLTGLKGPARLGDETPNEINHMIEGSTGILRRI